MKPRSAAEVLSEGPFAGLVAQSRRLERLTDAATTALREILPPQSPPDPPRCDLRDGTVVLTVSAPSQAAKLRQREGFLLRRLQECDAKVTGIRIRLQPGQPNYPEAASKQGLTPAEPMSEAQRVLALQFAQSLAEQLPDSPLRDAARRLQAALESTRAPVPARAPALPVRMPSPAAGKLPAPAGHRKRW